MSTRKTVAQIIEEIEARIQKNKIRNKILTDHGLDKVKDHEADNIKDHKLARVNKSRPNGIAKDPVLVKVEESRKTLRTNANIGQDQGRFESRSVINRDKQDDVICADPTPKENIKCSWHYGHITRKCSETMLIGQPDGTFLVRDSNYFPNDHTLCIAFKGAVKHYRIMSSTVPVADKEAKLQYTLDDIDYFDNLSDLVFHYLQDADGLCTKLTRAVLSTDNNQNYIPLKNESKPKNRVLPASKETRPPVQDVFSSDEDWLEYI